jgi:5-methylcytosine-specific restriction endonuclease McrA
VKRSRLTTAEKRERDAIRDRVFRRDGRCVIADLPNAGDCYGLATPHHRRKASQGGSYTEANLVTCCAHHNDQLEADADLAAAARAAGHVVRRGDPGWDQLG